MYDCMEKLLYVIFLYKSAVANSHWSRFFASAMIAGFKMLNIPFPKVIWSMADQEKWPWKELKETK